MKKQQMIPLVFLQSVQERSFFLGGPSKTGWMLFALMSGKCKQFIKACLYAQERCLWHFYLPIRYKQLSVSVHLCKQ